MAQNDYFVIAARILSYLYDRLKKGEDVECRDISATTLNINERYWTYIMENLFADGYITGVELVPMARQLEDGVSLIAPMITPKGIEYLMENTGIRKGLKYLGSIGEFIPGIADVLKFLA